MALSQQELMAELQNRVKSGHPDSGMIQQFLQGQQQNQAAQATALPPPPQNAPSYPPAQASGNTVPAAQQLSPQDLTGDSSGQYAKVMGASQAQQAQQSQPQQSNDNGGMDINSLLQRLQPTMGQSLGNAMSVLGGGKPLYDPDLGRKFLEQGGALKYAMAPYQMQKDVAQTQNQLSSAGLKNTQQGVVVPTATARIQNLLATGQLNQAEANILIQGMGGQGAQPAQGNSPSQPPQSSQPPVTNPDPLGQLLTGGNQTTTQGTTPPNMVFSGISHGRPNMTNLNAIAQEEQVKNAAQQDPKVLNSLNNLKIGVSKFKNLMAANQGAGRIQGAVGQVQSVFGMNPAQQGWDQFTDIAAPAFSAMASPRQPYALTASYKKALGTAPQTQEEFAQRIQNLASETASRWAANHNVPFEPQMADRLVQEILNTPGATNIPVGSNSGGNGGYSDPNKEARYQAWKQSQGK